MIQDGLADYRTHDHLTSTRDFTDATGALQGRYTYDPAGQPTKVAGNSDDPFTFTGVLTHQPSSLLLMKRRAYGPDLGRWLSEDPIGPRAGPNLYVYVRGNPLNVTDISGLAGVAASGGVQASGMLWLVGGSGSIGVTGNTSGQVCGVMSFCVRLGFGFFIGAGGSIGLGVSSGPMSDGWSCTVGAGADVGTGPSYGGQVGFGGGSAGGSSSHGGVGYGLAAGLEMCCSKLFNCRCK